ncbi:MAG: hypothetical protein ACQGVC_09590 [Myxococcota bacterium]
MSHPLIQLAGERAVRQATGFRLAAAELDGEKLAAAYATEKTNAPRLPESGKKYFVTRSGKPASERKRNKDEEHVGQALIRYCENRGQGLPFPDDDWVLTPLDYQVRVKAGPLDEPATKGIGRIDLLGITSEERLAVIKMRVLEPNATRCGVGDTPLRALLEGLTYAAIAEANQDALRSEIAERFGRTISDEPPLLCLLASQSYWRLCRKREAQKGAAWIKEMERLAELIGEEVGPTIRYLGLEMTGDPGWAYAEDGPYIDGEARLRISWEPGAGRVKPKPKPRPRPSAPVEEIVEADLSRPVRPYALTESFSSGDRIDHPKLGMGVVQGIAGPGKIKVRFDEKQSILVHER